MSGQRSAISDRDVIVVENYVDRQCVRRVHLMSNSRNSLLSAQREGGGEIKQGTGIHYYRAEYPYRGILDVQCEGWRKFRRLVVWSIDGYGSVRDAINDAFIYYWVTFKFRPGYCFFSKIPAGVEFGTPLSHAATSPHLEKHKMGGEGDLMLLEADWMLEKSVAVGGRF